MVYGDNKIWRPPWWPLHDSLLHCINLDRQRIPSPFLILSIEQNMVHFFETFHSTLLFKISVLKICPPWAWTLSNVPRCLFIALFYSYKLLTLQFEFLSDIKCYIDLWIFCDVLLEILYLVNFNNGCVSGEYHFLDSIFYWLLGVHHVALFILMNSHKDCSSWWIILAIKYVLCRSLLLEKTVETELVDFSQHQKP